MSYCIMHVAKRHRQDIGGLQREANREMDEGKYHNNVDLNRSMDNIYLVRSDNWYRDIKAQLESRGIKRVRKDAVMAITGVYTASPDWFRTSSREDMIAYLEDCMRFHAKYYGPVISAVIHMDETTPHLQICSVPITQDGRLSAKDLIGNRQHMTHLQTRFAREVGAMYGLQRGEDRSADSMSRHKSEQEYVIERNNESIAAQQRAITQGFRELTEIEAQRQFVRQDIANLHNELDKAHIALQEAQSNNIQLQYDYMIDVVNTALNRLPDDVSSMVVQEIDNVINQDMEIDGDDIDH